MKKQDEFMQVIHYLTHKGFKDKQEMEAYFKKNGFVVNFQNLYTDDENNTLLLNVDFDGTLVRGIKVIQGMPISILKQFDGISII